jgi:hypothetical protein
VDVAAPAKNINSTINGNSYKVFSGTSMAAPHAAGAIGLLIAKEGRIPFAQLKDRLMATATPVPRLRGKVNYTSGRLNVYNLITDTRPEKNYPKESQWESVSVPIWESSHPYTINMNESKTFRVSKARYIRLKVKKMDLELGYDFLEISDGKEVLDKMSGTGTGRVSTYADGDQILVTFKTDNSINKWGFIIDEVQVVY